MIVASPFASPMEGEEEEKVNKGGGGAGGRGRGVVMLTEEKQRRLCVGSHVGMFWELIDVVE